MNKHSRLFSMEAIHSMHHSSWLAINSLGAGVKVWKFDRCFLLFTLYLPTVTYTLVRE